jgi:hypothetical protein
MSRKRVLGPLSVVLLMFPLASCASVSPSAATTPTASASRNTDSVLSICAYGLLDVADDWQVAFLDYGAASSTGTELPALRALQEVADRLDKFKEPCTRERMSKNSELEWCAGFADIIEGAPQSLSDVFMKQLVAWDEGRYNAAAAVTSEISIKLSLIRSVASAGC